MIIPIWFLESYTGRIIGIKIYSYSTGYRLPIDNENDTCVTDLDIIPDIGELDG